MKNYQDAMNELIEFIDGQNEVIQVPTIRKWVEEHLKENKKYETHEGLSRFEEGDILFSEETRDYAPAIFMLTDYNTITEDGIINKGDWIVYNGIDWERVGSSEPLYDENGVSYCLATPEEIERFKKLTGRK